MSMIPVEEARARILAYVTELNEERQPLLAAAGQTLARDAVAGFHIPPLDNTAMDGYAVRAGDTTGASESSPVELRVTGELAAGYVFDGMVEVGCAVRIMTGAPMPAGADAVVPFEETDETGRAAPSKVGHVESRVRIFKAAALGANIRRAGEDVRAGAVIVPRGTVLRPAHLGVLASLGMAEIPVIRRPVVAILSTGDEIVPPGQPLGPGQIHDSNAYTVAAQVQRFGGIPRLLGIARDSIEEMTAKVREGLSADMLVTSAGVSRGDFDVVKEVLRREGEVDFWTVNMRPGKPLAFGAFRAPDGRQVPHLGLPGNPVSSAITFELFGRPAMQTMMGAPLTERPTVRAITRDRIRMSDERRFFARCIVTLEDGRYVASLSGSQSSGVLTALARANGLAVVHEGTPDIEPGGEVTVMMLDWE